MRSSSRSPDLSNSPGKKAWGGGVKKGQAIAPGNLKRGRNSQVLAGLRSHSVAHDEKLAGNSLEEKGVNKAQERPRKPPEGER